MELHHTSKCSHKYTLSDKILCLYHFTITLKLWDTSGCFYKKGDLLYWWSYNAGTNVHYSITMMTTLQVCINEMIWFQKRVYIISNTCLYNMSGNVNHSCSLLMLPKGTKNKYEHIWVYNR